MKLLKTASFVTAFAVIALFSAKSFAAVNAYLYIQDAKGQITKVPVSNDGSFTSPKLASGPYTLRFGIGRGISSSTGASADKYSTSSGGDNPTESRALNFTKITVTYDIVSPRDAATGLATGKRMHKPFVITKEVDKSSPSLKNTGTEAFTMNFGKIIIDMANDGISGKIVMTNTNGNKTGIDDWSK